MKPRATTLTLANQYIEARFDLARGCRLSALIDQRSGKSVLSQKGQRLVASGATTELCERGRSRVKSVRRGTLDGDPHLGLGQTAVVHIATTLDGAPLVLERRIDLPDDAGAVRILDTWHTKAALAGTWYSELGRFVLPTRARVVVHDWFSCSDQSNHRLAEHALKNGRERGLLATAHIGGDGVFFWKEAPAPDSRPVKGDWDFSLTDGVLTAAGTGFSRAGKNEARRSDALVIGILEDSVTLLGLRRWQRARYHRPHRTNIVEYIANSWQAYHLDVTAAAMTTEAAAAAQCGFQVYTIDDGWFATFMGEVDPNKFPHGLETVAAEAKAAGATLGLWMNPLGLDTRDPNGKLWDGAECHDTISEGNSWNWIARTSDFIPCETYISEGVRGYQSMDLCNTTYHQHLRNRILTFICAGITRYKFDLYQLDKYDCLTGDAHQHYEAYRHLLDELKAAGAVIEMDFTRSNRPGFDCALDYGRLFLANRGRTHKDHRWYQPWISLANLWDAARLAPAQLIELDIMPQLDEWPLDYVMATALTCNPLCFARFTSLNEQRRTDIRAWIDHHAALKARLADMLIVPVGKRPQADGWSGFAGIAIDGTSGLLIAYRNGPGAPPTGTFDLRGLGFGRVTAQIDAALGWSVIELPAAVSPRSKRGTHP